MCSKLDQVEVVSEIQYFEYVIRYNFQQAGIELGLNHAETVSPELTNSGNVSKKKGVTMLHNCCPLGLLRG